MRVSAQFRLFRHAVPLLFLFAVFHFFYVRSSVFADTRQRQTSGSRVIAIHDGDTVTLRFHGKNVRTRLIGIDAPEMGQRPWGRRSKDRLIEFMSQTGWYVYVETDVVQRDKYGRMLAYLWARNGEMINEKMAADGQAVAFVIEPNVKYAKRFTQAELQARSHKMGIWQGKGLRQSPAEYRAKHPRHYSRNAFPYMPGLALRCYPVDSTDTRS